jgi:hypothetical protein
MLFFSEPNLSDDFYRFYWDGLLSSNGINPFAFLPSEIVAKTDITIAGIDQELFGQLNSPEYYTIYPPWCQFVFMISAFISQGNIYYGILVMRIFAVLAELGSMLLLLDLLPRFGISKQVAILYFFNPMVIVELTGNLHYEVFMIFFTLLSIYFLKKEKLLLSAGCLALAVASKMLPLIFLPLFFRKLGLRISMRYYLFVGIFTVLAFLPLLGSAFLSGLSSSVSLYFQKFEFNASIYYLIREVGFWVVGWNIIGLAGKWLAFSVFVLIILLSLFYDRRANNLPGILVWPLMIYLSMATIVHPWYVTPLIAFCLFSNYRFPILWSLLALLSYEGYSASGFEENTIFLWIEYLGVFGWMIYELIREKNLIMLNYSPAEQFPMEGMKREDY